MNIRDMRKEKERFNERGRLRSSERKGREIMRERHTYRQTERGKVKGKCFAQPSLIMSC